MRWQDFQHRRAQLATLAGISTATFQAETDRAISCAPLSTDDRAGFRATLTTIRNLTEDHTS